MKGSSAEEARISDPNPVEPVCTGDPETAKGTGGDTEVQPQMFGFVNQ